jgi:hypothetical protein
MKLTTDVDKYLQKQEVFTGEMVARISEQLEGAGIAGKQLKELTGKIAFEIATMVDDTAGLEFDGIKSNLYLTFISEKDSGVLIDWGGSSTCHEMVFGILNAMFQDQ